jgi:hypothetical protein
MDFIRIATLIANIPALNAEEKSPVVTGDLFKIKLDSNGATYSLYTKYEDGWADLMKHGSREELLNELKSWMDSSGAP